MDEETEYIKLPVEDRCVHKLWKARVHGYEEVTKLFRTIDDEKSPEWNKYLGLIKKFAGDSNVAAQEKGLEATLAYIENAHVAGRTVGEVMSVIVNKCIAAPRTKIKELAVQISLMYIEIEKQESVVDELLKGAEHKNPKIAAACILTITQALKEFGHKVINMKSVLKKISALLEDRDKNVRDEAKALTVEIFRWIGPVFKSQLSNLKPLQIQELETEFDKVKKEKAMVTRYLRSQQEKQSRMAVGDGPNDVDDEDEGDGVGDVEIDPYDLLQPIDILSKLPKDFYEKLEAKKWQERKESLDCVEDLLSKAPKLENGDYGDLIRALKKVIIKDTNVILVGIGAKCMALLINALKKRFQPFAGNCLSSFLEKFKEKKQNVVLPLRDAVDALYLSTTLEAIQEDVLAAMENKNPSVKAETVAFLTRCFTKCTPIILNKKLLKAFITALIKTLNESDPVVRDNSAEAIGTAWKVVGDKAIAPFVTDVDNLKIAKIKEASEKAIITAKMPKVTSKKVAEPERPVTAPVKSKAGSVNPKPVRRLGSKPAATLKKSSSVTSIAGNKPTKSAKPVVERELTEEEVDEKSAEIFSDNIISGLTDLNWKTRLSAIEQFNQRLVELSTTQVQSQVLVRLLSKKPGFKDNNFQVLKLRLDGLKIVSDNFSLTSTAILSCLTDIIALLGDNKNGSLASDLLMEFADQLNLEYISNEVLNFAFSQQKNPKVQQEALTWLSNAILEFGFMIQPKTLMDNIKKGLAASNPQVRTAVISLLGTMYIYAGSQLGYFFENEKPALLQQINAEFDKHQGEKPPSPKRGKLKSVPTQNDEDVEDIIEQVNTNVKDMVPYVDISSKITDSLISELSDRDWKVRMEAINKLQEIINEAKFITNKLGDAAPSIAHRLTDSNGRLAAATVALCESIVVAMGPQCKTYVRDFLPGLLQGAGDNKNYLRSASMKCINTWSDTCGCKEFFEGEMIASALKSGSPTLRTELWTWLAEKLPSTKGIPKEELMACLSYLYSNLEDRNSDVRKSANDAVLGFMIHLGYVQMSQVCDKLKPSSASTVKLILERTRGNLPVQPTLQTKSKLIKPSGNRVTQQSTLTKGGNKFGTSTIVKSKPGAPVKRKKEDEADLSPLLKVGNLKFQRAIDEQKLKVLKWNFTTPREEFVDQLKDQMVIAGVNKTLISNMFHSDFKYHLKALDSLTEDLNNNSAAMFSNLDLLLKWITLRFFDTNPSVIMRCLEYLQTMFRILIENSNTITECEATGFIPYLVLKAGDPKDTVRASVKEILDLLCSLYPVSKLFVYIMDGVKSKNARQRTSCLEQLSRLIENYGISVCQPTAAQALKEIAKQISDRDNGVRNAALNCVVTAHFIAGDRVRQMIGQISDKDLSLLDERIKRATKNRQNIPIAMVKPTMSPQKRISQYEPVQQVNNNYETASEDDEEEEPGEIEERDEYQMGQITPPHISVHPSSNVNNIMPRSCIEDYLGNADHLSIIPEQYVSKQSDMSMRTASPNDASAYFLPDIALDLELDDSLSCTPSQQKKGYFGLDMDVIGALESTPVHHPKPNLVEYDNRYFQETVVPITTNVRIPASNYNRDTVTLVASKPSDLQSWISQIASQNLEESMKALEEVEFALLSDEKRKEFDGLEFHLFTQICEQFMNLYKSDEPDMTKCYKLIFSILMKIYNYPQHCQKITESLLQQILENLLHLLNDRRLESLDRANMFVKVVNNLVLRILDRSDHTFVTCAFLRMLYDTVDTSDTSPRYQELVMKCIWKAVKYIPEWDCDLDYNKILLEMHRFFNDFPSSWWKKQESDTPLRTFKTIAHTMVKVRGTEVMNCVNNLPGVSNDAEIVTYVSKLLRHLRIGEKGDETPERMKQHVSRSLHDELATILKKIGNQEETQQGLKLLHEFMRSHPEVNISPFLSKSTKFFQDYIKRGLESVDNEKAGYGDKECNINIINNINGDKYSEHVKQIEKHERGDSCRELGRQVDMSDKGKQEESESDVIDFKQRLQVLQRRAGWEQNRVPVDAVPPTVDQPPNFIPVIRRSSPQQMYHHNAENEGSTVEQLKYKLAMLKQGKL